MPAAGAGALEEHGGPGPVLGAPRGDDDADEQPEGVDEEVALAAVDVLVVVVAAGRRRDDALGGLVHRLGVDDPADGSGCGRPRPRMTARSASTIPAGSPVLLHREWSP